MVLTLSPTAVHLFHQRYHLTQRLSTGFCAKAPVFYEKDIPYSVHNELFRCGGILDSSGPHLANGGFVGVTFHFLLAMGKRSVLRGCWLPFLPS